MQIELTTIQIILLLIFITINFIALIYIGLDKRKAIRNMRRIPEAHLLFLAICFCAPGIYLGMLIFRHKTKKIYFRIGIPLAIIQNIGLLYLIYTWL